MAVCDHDEDSLFGSPPSSPVIRGRSPPLALPSGHGLQNVGTIALPGSHICSKSPVNPLALSCCTAPELPARPPAQPNCINNGPVHPTQQSSQSSSRASSVPAKKSRSKQKKSTPRPLPLPITLPNPNSPPPANFLRNQQALLGVAGLVGGVNPTMLSTQRSSLGSSCTNPILVDDENDQVRLGRKTRSPSPIDPTFLTPPSQQHIIESLIKQKNIFPVLESLLKILGAGGLHNQPSSRTVPECRRQSEEPQAKKRKMTSVPAGASDWDVPFPFPEGEGPKEYRTNWERERCKELIMELLSSLKSAARTAATRTYLQQRKQVKERSVTPTSSSPLSISRQVPATSGNDTSQTTPSLCVPGTSNSLFAETSLQFDAVRDSISDHQPMFEQLFAPLLQTENISAAGVNNFAPEDLWPEMDPVFCQSWKSLLESFTNDKQESSSVSIPSVSTASRAVSAFDSDITSVIESATSRDFPINSEAHPPTYDSLPDFAIDPALLAISFSSDHSGANASTSSHNQSSVPSTRSVMDPQMQKGDLSLSEPEMLAEHLSTEVNGPFQLSEAFEQTTSEPLTSSEPARHIVTEHASTDINEPLQLSEEFQPPMSTATPSMSERATSVQDDTSTTTLPFPVITNPIAATSSLTTPGPGRTTTEKLWREEILRRSRERRRQLIAGIEEAKVELWETTIEQGVLAHIAKEKP